LAVARGQGLTNRCFCCRHASVESIRKQIEGHTTISEKVSTSVDLALSNECKRCWCLCGRIVLTALAQTLGTEHLLLCLLREEECLPRSSVMSVLRRRDPRGAAAYYSGEDTLIASARVTRRAEYAGGVFARLYAECNGPSLIRCLAGCRSGSRDPDSVQAAKNHPVLIGEPGVWKTCDVAAWPKIASGEVADFSSGQTGSGAHLF